MTRAHTTNPAPASQPGLPYPAVALAREAMATRFELVLPGPPTAARRAAGEEALDEIERQEAQLSLYRPGSEIANANARAAQEPVRLSPPVFALLQRAQQLHRETAGAFDITIGPLLRCWGFLGATGAWPKPETVAAARSVTGMDLVDLDPAHRTVRFQRPGVMLDLGAIGKGYAIDRAIEILREAGITDALLHGGTSSVFGLGAPPDTGAWRIAIEAEAAPPGSPKIPLAIVELHEESLSVSAVWGKSFQAEGKTHGHILDPRTGQPADGARLSAVILPSATEGDAISTALLVDARTNRETINRLRPDIKTVVVWEGPTAGQLHTAAQGLKLLPSAPQ